MSKNTQVTCFFSCLIFPTGEDEIGLVSLKGRFFFLVCGDGVSSKHAQVDFFDYCQKAYELCRMSYVVCESVVSSL